MPLSKIKTNSIADEVFEAGPNMLINGGMTVSQRGTVTGATLAYGPDRFQFARGGGAAVTLSQDSDVPSNQGFANSLKVDVTTADSSVAASDFAMVRQILEAQNCQHLLYGTSEAKKITIQFWVKSSKTGTHIFELYHYDATYFSEQAYTIASANTWQKVTLTFDGYQTTGFADDNASGLQATWWLMTGSTYGGGTFTSNSWHNVQANRAVGQVNVMDSTDNNFYITGVQMEVGEQATPFQHEDYAVTLHKCRRYYQINYASWYGVAAASGYFESDSITYNPPVRANPTVAQVSFNSGSGGRFTATAATSSTIDGTLIYSSPGSAGGNSGWNANWSADAEL